MLAGRFIVDEKHHAYEGELAQVLRTYDSKDQMRPAAVKLFRDGSLDTRVVLEAFARECESLMKLNAHANVIPLIEYGTDEDSGRKYIALEWAESNLLQHVRKHPESDWDGFYERFGKAVLDALAFAYANDILHRDVKPQNILIDASGAPRVADFGISKFRRYYRPGVTLAHFKSKPYAPEIERDQYPDARDVYGFAVLCLECLSDIDLEDYPDVDRALDEVALPAEVREILGRALQREPQDRQANVAQLQDELAAAQERRSLAMVVRRVVAVQITATAARVMALEYGERNHEASCARLLQELNEVCGIERTEDEGGSENHLALMTAELRCRVVVDERRGGLSVIGVARSAPSSLERRRDRAWKPRLRFVHAAAAETEGALDWLMDGLDEFLSERRVADAHRRESELFDRWAAMLRLKTQVEDERTRPIRYDGVRQEGLRLHLGCGNADPEIVGEDRVIRGLDERLVAGIVESVQPETIVLDCYPGQDFSQVPQRGELAADTRQAKIAIRRQNGALDALRFRRAARPDLRELLLGTTAPVPGVPGDDIGFFQENLDEDKKDAVVAALAATDFMIVEGPPGTGKTRFVTELIAQTLRLNPDARILLSSQTHIALDHALSGVEELARKTSLPLRAVRIARPGDSRVSSSVDHLVLERQVKDWLAAAGARSEKFLVAWAAERGISEEYVRIGMALSDLRTALEAQEAAEADLVAATTELMELSRRERELRDDPDAGDEYRTVQDELQLAQDVADECETLRLDARQRMREAQRRARTFPDLAESVDTLTTTDMEGLEADFVAHASGGEEYRRMLVLAEEWRMRFGRPLDFFGAYLAACNLVAGTCLGVAAQSMQDAEFDLCIVDEASKASPTEILVPMVKARKWVIVGDPQQLPPFVEAGVPQELLDRNGLTRDDIRTTLLDHLIDTAPESARRSLLTQHRMVKPIGDLVSHCFYGGRLRNVNEKVDDMLAKSLALPRPVTWFTTSADPARAEVRLRGSYANRAEIDSIGRILGRLELAAQQRGSRYSVALLSGYGAQVVELERLWRASAHRYANLDVTCATVDSFQGREADVAVYSVTRSNQERKVGFLVEEERLNVALSRGRVGLAIVGDSMFCEAMGGTTPFASVMDYIRGHADDCSIVKA